MKRLNFIPDSFFETQTRRRFRVRFGIAVAVVVVIGGAGLVLQTRSHLAGLESELTVLRRQSETLRPKDTGAAEAAEAMALPIRLESPIPATSILAAIAELMPPSLGLGSLSLIAEPMEPVPVDPKKRRKRQDDDDAPTPPGTLVIDGLTPDNVILARFIGRLAEHPLFEKVELGYCRPTEGGELMALEFRIASRVPLDRVVTLNRRLTHAD